ncbi:multicopper oxidase family protein, partial [Caenispirillum salinarum]|uniref:multicopper oxidase family protein n=1 Tax=Caenispirillum salinarum TaxID=859058 RepID=UPI0005B8A6B2
AMDGVPGLTQEAVPQGETFDYAFDLKDAGTFWYHSHQRAWEQVARGVYGVLIVDEAEPPQVDQDLLLVVDDWLLDRDGRFVEETLGALHDWGHGGRMGNVVTVNGRVRPDIPVRRGERLRLRLLNPSNARILALTFGSLRPTVVALDGRPCRPHPVSDHGLLLGSGQRADLMVDVDAEPGTRIAIADQAYDDPAPVAHIAVADDVLRETPLDAPLALPGVEAAPVLDLETAVTADLLMQGGAMGTMDETIYNGQRMGWRDLVRVNRVWAFNGVAGDLDTPLLEVPRGRTAAVT